MSDAVRSDCLLLCARAGELLKAAGFVLVRVSAKSEACYYALPGRHGTLRVANHQSHRGPIGQDDNQATLTFRGGRRFRSFMMMSEHRFQQMVWIAIGQYICNSTEPKSTRYIGKRGTWETANRQIDDDYDPSRDM